MSVDNCTITGAGSKPFSLFGSASVFKIEGPVNFTMTNTFFNMTFESRKINSISSKALKKCFKANETYEYIFTGNIIDWKGTESSPDYNL